MAKTLTQIQTIVRFNSGNDTIDLTTATGLSISNNIYRAVGVLFSWPELRETKSLSTTTTSGTSQYNWTFSPTAVFTNVRGIEVQASSTATTYYILYSPESETAWNDAGNDADGVPVYYVRHNVAGTNVITMRPAPNFTGAIIRVIGEVEPADLTTGSSTTRFLLSSADDALAYLIAATYLIRSGFYDRGEINTGKAIEILQTLFSKDEVPAEVIRNLVGLKNG